MSKHSSYIRENNEIIKDEKLYAFFIKTAGKVCDYIDISLQQKAIPDINDFIVSIIKLDSLSEEMAKRILSLSLSKYKIFHMKYSEILYTLDKEESFNTKPFEFLRVLRNKLTHVVNPVISAKVFLSENKNSSLKKFAKDIDVQGRLFADCFSKSMQKKNILEEQVRADLPPLNNVYKLKL